MNDNKPHYDLDTILHGFDDNWIADIKLTKKFYEDWYACFEAYGPTPKFKRYWWDFADRFRDWLHKDCY